LDVLQSKLLKKAAAQHKLKVMSPPKTSLQVMSPPTKEKFRPHPLEKARGPFLNPSGIYTFGRKSGLKRCVEEE